MKIFIPIEVPDDTYSITINATALSPEEEHMGHYAYDELDIERFYRFAKLAETQLVKEGLL